MESQTVNDVNVSPRNQMEDGNVNWKESVEEKKKPTFDFKEKTWKDDFVLIVENTRLHVVKAILAYASPVFDTMFQAEFKEKNLSELELPGKKIEDIQQFLRCIYPQQEEINSENIKAVLPLAEEYQVSNLKSRCETLLFQQVNETKSPDDVYNILELASHYNMPHLLKTCINIASDLDFESYQRADKRLKMEPEEKCMILERKVSRLQPKNLLEVVKGYYECYLKPDEILKIENYTEWDGIIFDITASLGARTLFELNLHGVNSKCSISILEDNWFNKSSAIKIEHVSEERKIDELLGQITIQPNNNQFQVVSRKFECYFNKGVEVAIQNLVCGKDFEKKGFIFHDKLTIKMYFLAKRCK